MSELNDVGAPLSDPDGLVRWANRLMLTRNPDFVVSSSAGPQLLRWFVVPRNPVRNVYLHRFLRDDPDLHDHPWDNESLILDGRYEEVFQDGTAVIRSPGNLVRRSAIEAHRVRLLHGQPVTSLFFTGPIVRRWGFYPNPAWRFWKDHVIPTPTGNRRREEVPHDDEPNVV